jgi:hypothetical protein
MKFEGRFAIAALVLLLTLSVSSATAADYWPTEGWRTSTPEEQGMDSGRLADMLEWIEIKQRRIDSVTVIRNGYIVLDAYFYPYERDLNRDSPDGSSRSPTMIALRASDREPSPEP